MNVAAMHEQKRFRSRLISLIGLLISQLATLSALVLTPVQLGATDNSPTMTGTVCDEAGKPLSGASIFISTAAPRKGVGVL
jgi:hypothetical protein